MLSTEPLVSLDAGRFRQAFSRVLRWCVAWRTGSPVYQEREDPQRAELARQAITDAIAKLAACGRFDEADQMARRGLEALPDERGILLEYALSAHHAGHYAQAIERWEHALRRAPETAICYAGLAANLRETKNYPRAQTILVDGLRAFPRDLALLTEAARLAAAQSDFRTALAYWEKACARKDPHPDWLQGRAQSLVMLGRYDEAGVALKEGRTAFPDHMGLRGVEGLLASSREDWPSAITFWAEYRRQFPEDTTGWEQLGVARQAHELGRVSGDADAFVPDLPVKLDMVEDDAIRRLLLRFESIGDNCELGLVQRRYGAEPLGLLRWNTVGFDHLVEALGHRFQGMGEEANTVIDVAANGEFYVFDRRWSLGMHTFLYSGQTSKDALYGRMCRRVTYLRDKILSDLADAEKIFVYRSPGVDAERLDLLHRALRDIGPVTLLVAQSIDANSPFRGLAGDILRVGDQRYIGFLSRDGRDANGNWDIAFDDWLSVCRKMIEAV